MSELKTIDLAGFAEVLRHSAKPVSVLWQQPDTLAFVARGRPHRNEFHVDPADEVMYMIKGEMELHYIGTDGRRAVAVVREGEILHCPAGTPHSPRFPPDALLLVLERKRLPGEQDRFLWFCERCDSKLYEATRIVADYDSDPVSSAYGEFYATEANRTCKRCGHVAPHPPG